MNLRFYKEEENWYVDLPKYIEEGGSKEDLQMVMGADAWLSEMTEGGDEITLQISTEPFDENSISEKLVYVGDLKSSNKGDYLVYPHMHRMWLCGVTEWLFGKYPDAIYYREVESGDYPEVEGTLSLCKEIIEERELDKFYYHEVLDRLMLTADSIDRHLLEHPVCQKHTEISEIISDALSKLADAYAEMGKIVHEKE